MGRNAGWWSACSPGPGLQPRQLLGTRPTAGGADGFQLRTQAPRPPPCFLGNAGPPAGPRAPRPRGTPLSEALQSSLCSHCPTSPLLIHIFIIATIRNSFAAYISSFHLHDTYFFCPDSVPSPEQSLALAGVCLASRPSAATCARSSLLPAAFSCRRPPTQPHAHSFTICHPSVLCSVTRWAPAGDPAPALTPPPPQALQARPF